ncbi:MAG: sigma-70 family RNA polymerase sigma factor [Bacteroidales bacterium]|nr:sigma-70 family RNA polymerase sigma factor [Bacteroidales bacterium]
MKNHNQPSDYDLITKFVNGEDNALESLIRRHKNKVYTYIYYTVKSESFADDIFQDTFIKVIDTLKRGKYQDNGRFVSWVTRIAHNLIVDHYRKAKKINTTSDDDQEWSLLNDKSLSEENIEDHLIKSQIHNDVQKLVKALPQEQREIIMLRHYMGLSFQEIAEQTDVSINTALGRMRYAILNLKKMATKNNISLSVI